MREGDGKRYIHCSACETAWAYYRLRCPTCDNQDTQTVRRLQVEGEEGIAAQVCLRCGYHLKEFDRRVLAGPLIPWLDDAATWRLDLAAARLLEETETATMVS